MPLLADGWQLALQFTLGIIGKLFNVTYSHDCVKDYAIIPLIAHHQIRRGREKERERERERAGGRDGEREGGGLQKESQGGAQENQATLPYS